MPAYQRAITVTISKSRSRSFKMHGTYIVNVITLQYSKYKMLFIHLVISVFLNLFCWSYLNLRAYYLVIMCYYITVDNIRYILNKSTRIL